MSRLARTVDVYRAENDHSGNKYRSLPEVKARDLSGAENLPGAEVCERGKSGFVTLMLCDKRQTWHKSVKRELSCPGFFSPLFEYIKPRSLSSVGLRERARPVAWLTGGGGPALRFIAELFHSAAVVLTFNVGKWRKGGLLIWLWRSVNYITVLYLLQISHCVITASVRSLKVEGGRDGELRRNSS